MILPATAPAKNGERVDDLVFSVFNPLGMILAWFRNKTRLFGRGFTGPGTRTRS